MNKNGQALVEFIIILPVLTFLLMGIVDLGNILYQKYKLENDLDYISELYSNNKGDQIDKYADENKLKVSYNKNIDTVTISLTKYVNIITPGINVALDDPYNVTVKRVMYVE